MRFPALPLALLMLLSACAGPQNPEEKALARSRVLTNSHAIDAVRHDIRTRGGKPETYDYTAGRRGTQWFVTAWHIRHPQAKGAARFDPGGFVTYLISPQGQVMERTPGRG